MEGAASSILFSTSKPGWMEEANFTEWVGKVKFMPSVKSLLATGPVFLLLDGHTSHHSLNYNAANSQGQWHYYILPPTTYHTSTPASGRWPVRPTKEGMEKILQEYKFKTKAARVDRATVPLLLDEL